MVMKKSTKDLYAAFEDVFSYAKPEEWREILWTWYAATVTGNYNKALSRQERTEIKAAFELLYKAMETLRTKK